MTILLRPWYHNNKLLRAWPTSWGNSWHRYVWRNYVTVTALSCHESRPTTYTVTQEKDITQPPTIISTIVFRFQQFLVQILPSKYAIERWFNTPPQVLIVRRLHPHHNKCSKCCPSACTHTLTRFPHSLMAASITFCCRLFQTSRCAEKCCLQKTYSCSF